MDDQRDPDIGYHWAVSPYSPVKFSLYRKHYVLLADLTRPGDEDGWCWRDGQKELRKRLEAHYANCDQEEDGRRVREASVCT